MRRLLILFLAGLLVQVTSAQIVYLVDKPEEADVVIFLVDSEEASDLKVFFADEIAHLGKEGVWMGTYELKMADLKIHVAFEEEEAQLKVFQVETRELSGWRNEEKKKLLWAK